MQLGALGSRPARGSAANYRSLRHCHFLAMFQDVSFAKVGTGTPVDIVVQVTRTERDHVSLQALWHGENCRALHADFQAGEIRTPYGYVVHHSQGTAHLLLPGLVAQAVRVQRKRQGKLEPESFVQDTQAAGTTDSALWKGLLSVQQNFPNCPTVLLSPISAEDLLAVVGSLTNLSAFAEVPAGTLLLLAFLHDGRQRRSSRKRSPAPCAVCFSCPRGENWREKI